MGRWKQGVSILVGMALLLYAVIPTAGIVRIAAEEADNYVIVFDGADKCQNGTVDNVTFTYSGNATPSYDKTEDALLMTTTGTNAYLMTNVTKLNISASGYPVLAYRIRMKESNANADLRLQLLASTDKSNTSVGPSNYNNLISGKTADWQTYSCNFSQSTDSTNLNNLGADAKYWQGGDYAGSVWANVSFNYPNWRSNMNLPYYVEWMGFFKSEADAKAFTKPEKAKAYRENYVISFDSEEKTKAGNLTAEQATISYDSQSRSMKVVTTGTANQGFGVNVAARNVSTITYPVVAYRVRLAEVPAADVKYYSYPIVSTTMGAVTNPTTWAYHTLKSGNATDSIVWNFADSGTAVAADGKAGVGENAKYWTDAVNYGSNTWNNVMLYLPSYRSAGTSITYYVEWVGFFRTTAEAKAYTLPAARTDGASIRIADSNDLRVKFRADIRGVTYAAGENYVALGNYTHTAYTTGTLTVDGVACPATKLGVLMVKASKRNFSVTDVLCRTDGAPVADVEALKMYDIQVDSCSYVVRINNIPETDVGSIIYFQPYITYTKDGYIWTEYGNIIGYSYAQVAGNM